MLLFRSRTEDSTPAAVGVFGVGLVGGAVADALIRRGFRRRHLAVSWTDAEVQAEDLARVHEAILRTTGGQPGPVSLLWAAGRAGFGSDEPSTRQEMESFRAVLALGEQLVRAGLDLSFQLISSVGGLFEGQRFVDLGSRPVALRPYGRLKADQEAALLESPAGAQARIFRLTSVYGVPSGRVRRGLIPTLLTHGARQQTTRIVGRLDTLRDFVWARDVGRFVAERLLTPGVSAATTSFLASGRPSSILEILRLVEHVLDRPLLLQFAEASNSLDITVAPSALPNGWQATPLETAVRQVFLETRR